MVWQDTNGEINISNPAVRVALGTTQGSNPSSVAPWVSNDLYSFAFCLGGTISAITEITSTSPPYLPYVFTPAIPMLPDPTTSPAAATVRYAAMVAAGQSL